MQHVHTAFCCFEKQQFYGRARAWGEHIKEEISTRETKHKVIQATPKNKQMTICAFLPSGQEQGT